MQLFKKWFNKFLDHPVVFLAWVVVMFILYCTSLVFGLILVFNLIFFIFSLIIAPGAFLHQLPLFIDLVVVLILDHYDNVAEHVLIILFLLDFFVASLDAIFSLHGFFIVVLALSIGSYLYGCFVLVSHTLLVLIGILWFFDSKEMLVFYYTLLNTHLTYLPEVFTLENFIYTFGPVLFLLFGLFCSYLYGFYRLVLFAVCFSIVSVWFFDSSEMLSFYHYLFSTHLFNLPDDILEILYVYDRFLEKAFKKSCLFLFSVYDTLFGLLTLLLLVFIEYGKCLFGFVYIFRYPILLLLSLLVLTLINIAFATLAERKLMASIQRRRGPDVTGLFGFLQPFADGLKLVLKEAIVPKKATKLLFVFAPLLVLWLSLVVWIFMPFGKSSYIDSPFGLLYILMFGVIEIYGIIFAGWASNSKYAFLGGLRSSAQMISYEISLSFIYLAVVLLTGSFNLQDIVYFQSSSGIYLLFPLLPLAIVFLISMLAETNRTPFDLPEAEAELVAGYNVEYSGILFAMFFLGEYSTMLFLSVLFVTLFLGGWGSGSVFFILKILLILFFFIWVRATLPRYRYDQLMDLGWKFFLPITFSYLVFLVGLLYFTGTLPVFSDFFFIL